MREGSATTRSVRSRRSVMGGAFNSELNADTEED